MPDLTPVHIALLAGAVVVGVILGWLFRSNRSSQEKAAVNAGWQEQIEAQRVEHGRLTEQNKSLMEQISQLQASNIDAKNRAKELSGAVQLAYGRRDELQRELKDIRTNLETAMNERDQLRSDIDETSGVTDELQDREVRIVKLETELENWQNRLPPLIERFRVRNEEAEQLDTDLNAARARIRELEAMIEHGQTRIEPVEDPDTLTDGRDASNDAIDSAESMIEEAVMLADPQPDAEEEPEDQPEFEEFLNMDSDNDDTDAEEAQPDALNGSRDNLKLIKGVGPAIEKTLNELGIFSFEQIADMSEYDIDRVANRLRGFRSRIYREDWIGQARELRDRHSGI